MAGSAPRHAPLVRARSNGGTRFFVTFPAGFVWNRRHTQHNGSFDPGETRCPSRKPHRTIDSVIDGFLQAVRSMKNKDAELVEFLDKFDGVCLEAKSDNV